MSKIEALLAPRLESDQTALASVADWVSDGKSLAALGRELGVSRSALATFSNADPNVMRVARLDGAGALADEARRVLGECEETREGIAKARAISDLLMHVASEHNRAEYGEVPASFSVNLNAGAAHLLAMKELRSRHISALTSGVIEDAEIVDE
jgi:hypothetical protein